MPNPQNIYIVYRCPTINYQVLTRVGWNDRCNLRTNLLFPTNSQNYTSRVPFLFLVLFLTWESRCGARHSTYRISNVIKLAWLRSPYRCDTVVVFVVGDSSRPRAIPLAMLPMKKETLGFHNFYAWFFLCFSNFYRYGAPLPGPSCRRSSATNYYSCCCALAVLS